jgi:superoxide dismutase
MSMTPITHHHASYVNDANHIITPAMSMTSITHHHASYINDANQVITPKNKLRQPLHLASDARLQASRGVWIAQQMVK